MPPTSIDGTDITGATIDGTDVQEITVDGQTVFTSAPQINNFPVAYSNLIAWYPFDSATYGGSNADDVTAILGGSGDNTAFDGTVNGATYQSSGGVTDINAGANSGNFDFDGSNDFIELPFITAQDSNFTAGIWANIADLSTQRNFFTITPDWHVHSTDTSPPEIEIAFFDNTTGPYLEGGTPSANTWIHVVIVRDMSNGLGLYVDGNLVDSNNFTGDPRGASEDWEIGRRSDFGINHFGQLDDFRVYNRVLSSSEISQWYTNTQP